VVQVGYRTPRRGYESARRTVGRDRRTRAGAELQRGLTTGYAQCSGVHERTARRCQRRMERHDEQLRVADNAASRTIATILRHDAKVTSYKLALIRAINDVVLSFPDAGAHDRPVAIPLRVLAEYWVAYYWPFVDPHTPISQGPHSLRNGVLANDMAFRPALAAL
jgi:hypothetical protein